MNVHSKTFLGQWCITGAEKTNREPRTLGNELELEHKDVVLRCYGVVGCRPRCIATEILYQKSKVKSKA